ncbi:hypothetical protein ACWDFL_36550 [Streptomyces bungoensis]
MVRHGQASCADYGCTRAECRQAALRARRQRNQDHARGLSARIPPHAAARWAVRLRERGMSAQDITDRAGPSVTLVRRVLRTPAHDPGHHPHHCGRHPRHPTPPPP